jgi:glycosyltransferase involved in cell wall biosynthesis
MRIGMMLRSLDERGGIGVYTKNLLQELLSIDDQNQYILFYRNPANLGRFAQHSNVTEVVVKAPNKALWDQVAIPLSCWRQKVDVVFHTKFTAPLLAPCRAVMVVHGADWFIPEQARFYHPLDVGYTRLFMPLYFKKCDVVISVSQLTTDNFYSALNLPPDKIRTVYFGPGRHFKQVTDKTRLYEVTDRYHLPTEFILTLTKRGGDGRKNLGQIFKAYAAYHQRVEKPFKLVVGGEDGYLFQTEYGLDGNDYGRDVLFPGWIEQRDLPAVYSLAGLFLYPSNLEAFPIPITEAMACGTPIVTSNVNGLREIAGEAAVLVDPDATHEISAAIYRALTDVDLRITLSSKGLERARQFNWDKCAKETLEIIQELDPGMK